MTELCVIHPGELSPLVWPRLAALGPAGARLRVLELEALNGFWEHDGAATVDGLADRLRVTLDPRVDRVLIGWGVGGVVAEALAARLTVAPRRTVLLDAVSPRGARRPTEAALRRSYAMLLGARRGRALAAPTDTLDGLVARLGELGLGGAEALRKGYFQHARRHGFNQRLIAAHEPAGVPVTVVRPAESLHGALGWERTNPVESLASGGNHYTMLTEHAAMLGSWLTPGLAAA